MTDITPETFEWLAFHKNFQEETYGTDYSVFEQDFEALTAFVHWNHTAATVELGEALEETPWKPWSSADKAQTWRNNRDKYVGELIDVSFFLANMFIAAKVTKEEFAERYLAKAGVNVKRQEVGYDGHATKCPGCKRELDREGAYTISEDHGHMLSFDAPPYDLYSLSCTSALHAFLYTVRDAQRSPYPATQRDTEMGDCYPVADFGVSATRKFFGRGYITIR